MYLTDDRDDMIDDGLVDDDDDDDDDDDVDNDVDDGSDLSILGASTAATELKACSWNE
jgi:hypothetical protein